MKKNTLLTLLFLTMTMAVHAIPAKRIWRTMNQPDGSKVELMLVGDEHHHYFITADDMPVVEQNGSYYFAKATRDELVATNIMAKNVDKRTAAEQQQLTNLIPTWNSNRQLIRQKAERQNFPKKLRTARTPIVGKKKGLIILVSFNDKDFVTPKSTFVDMANKEGYNQNGAIGSVHDYFHDNSYGKFDLTFDVVGPYPAPKSWAWYGTNLGNNDNPSRVFELMKFAMTEAGKDVDYKNYDWNGDGEVDQVYIVYAGYAESAGADSRTIWPHESQLGGVIEWEGETYDLRLKINDMYLNTYACGSELSGTSGNTVDGIGTMCHEFSHCLGLPDFYDTKDNESGETGNYGMDAWDVMAAGAYNGDSNIPMGYTGYERHFCGWLNYQELTDPCKVSNIKPIGNGGSVFRIANPANDNEYYLIEYHNTSNKWDQGLGMDYLGVSPAGLMITHVTYDEKRWENNTVNRTGAGYQCMTIFHADNSEETTYKEGSVLYLNPIEYKDDLYPITGNNALTDESVPAATLNTPNNDGSYLMHQPITNITKRLGNLSFTFMDGTEEYVTGIKGINQPPLTPDDNKLYTLSGQYVGTTTSSLPKGIYLQDGKKVVVK